MFTATVEVHLVDVHGVVVHVGGSGSSGTRRRSTCGLGDGSRTRSERNLMYPCASRVVVELDEIHPQVAVRGRTHVDVQHDGLDGW